MSVARIAAGRLQVVDRQREPVRLGAGLQQDRSLSEASQSRALTSLRRFGQRLRSMPEGSVRAVGTYTLRRARGTGDFLARAQQVLGHPVEVIAGREAARLAYLGVAHGLPPSDERRLVVDVGGGSTELTIGSGFEPLQRESLHMGCVSMSHAWFPDGSITPQDLDRARRAARLEVRPVETLYRATGWQVALGCSGTIRAIGDVVQAAGWSDHGITRESLRYLRERLLQAGSVGALQLDGLDEDRRTVFPGGFAVLSGVFEALGIELMRVSDAALREGVLYDLMERLRHDDIRGRTVAAFSGRCDVDREHAARVEATALQLLDEIGPAWRLNPDEVGDMLSWAARLHEAGLAVSHSQYQKHGAYLLEHADLAGFSGPEQRILAALVRGHRRKFPRATFAHLPEACSDTSARLCILLRLAVLFHRSRDGARQPRVHADVGRSRLKLLFPERWLDAHPLTRTELEREAAYLKPAGIRLRFG